MPNTLNFSECYRILGTNPKTFKRWLEDAHIDPEKQVNVADPRQKYLTLDQVQMLAAQHGRTLPSLEEEETAAAPVTMEQVSEQLATIQNLLTDMVQLVRHPLPAAQEQVDYQMRFDRLDQVLAQVTTLVQERIVEHKDSPSSQREPKASVQAEPQSVQVVDEPPPQPLPISEAVTAPSAPPTPITPITPMNPSRTTLKQAKTASGAKRSTGKKRSSKAKSLPRTLVPLRVFAKLHEIDMKAADRASESGKISVKTGNWLYESRVVAKALDADGQRTFYDYFSTKEGFTRCDQCPHGAQEQDHHAEAEAVSMAG